HLLDQPPVLLLDVGPLAEHSLGGIDARGELVAEPLELGEGEHACAAAARGHAEVEPLARPGGAEESGELVLEARHLLAQRLPGGALVGRRPRDDRSPAGCEQLSHRSAPSDSNPRRSACRPCRPRARGPCSAPSTWPSPFRRPPGRPTRCSRSSNRPARSPWPWPCP